MSLEKRVKPKSRPGSAISYESPSRQRQMEVLPPENTFEYDEEDDEIIDELESLQELENAINEYSLQKELGIDSPFITALKLEAYENNTNNENDNNDNNENNNNESSNTENIPNTTTQETELESTLNETEGLEEVLSRISSVQDQRRRELALYLTDLKGSRTPSVQFPSNFEEIVETSDPEQSSKPMFWSKFLETDLYPVDKEKKELSDKIQKGLERIHKLDMILANKTKEARAIKASMMNNQGGGGNLKKSAEFKETKQEARDFSLKPEEEARVEEILKDEDLQSGFSLSNEQIQKIEEINKKLEGFSPNLDNLVNIMPTTQQTDPFSKNGSFQKIEILKYESEKEDQKDKIHQIDEKISQLESGVSLLTKASPIEIQAIIEKYKDSAPENVILPPISELIKPFFP